MAALVTPTVLREHVETDLPDSALTRILDDADREIARICGPIGATHTVRLWGGDEMLFLAIPAASITTITETVADVETILASDDYRIWPAGFMIQRLHTGTNTRSTWGDEVEVIYTPVAETDRRIRVEIDLARLAIQYNALAAESVGEYDSTSADYSAERYALLSALRPSQLGVIS